ncbi:PEPxxWA-CTERM sorting domain-containing protein [Polymorphobacter sp.]|uniref:PEPxxWA-CTERM sorting domain-containing protein n=1 Tax=Polymorphobacter sp. TaxID=1909290 RepID=UPI003F6E4FF1
MLATAAMPTTPVSMLETMPLPDFTGFSNGGGSGFRSIAAGGQGSIMPFRGGPTPGPGAPAGPGDGGGVIIIPPTEGVGDVVPEPGTWTLMIGGFGVLGMAMRNRRQSGQTDVS